MKILLPICIIFLVIAYRGEASEGPILPCIFNKITGLYCSGCGMTRAVNSILHFRIYAAIKYNALIVAMPPFMVLYFILKYKRHDRGAKKILYIMLALTLTYAIIRNFSIFNYL